MKKGFTLAEVLITIGIIGVVSAISIPTLLQNFYEKKTISTLRESQSILAQAFKMAEEEYGDVEGWVEEDDEKNIASEKIFEKLKPFLKIATICGKIDTERKCFSDSYRYLYDSPKTPLDYSNEASKYKIILLNGASIAIATTSKTQYTETGARAQINIDTNGSFKPNLIGKDVFIFRYGNNSLYPMGDPHSKYPYETYCLDKTEPLAGAGCAYYVLTNQKMDYLH